MNLVEVVALAAAAVFVVMLFAYHPNTAGGHATGATTSDPGAQVFAANCARCHGSNGEGGTGPQLAGRVVNDFPDPQAQVTFVRNGRGGMPSFDGILTDQEIAQVVDYTRTLK